MPGPLDFLLDPANHPEQLMVMTTDRATGAVTGAVSLGESWDHLLCQLVIDEGRQARMEPDAQP